jgi:hypothetical protein
MAVFFLDVVDRDVIDRDATGMDFADLAGAVAEAEQAMTEFRAESDAPLEIIVRDRTGIAAIIRPAGTAILTERQGTIVRPHFRRL